LIAIALSAFTFVTLLIDVLRSVLNCNSEQCVGIIGQSHDTDAIRLTKLPDYLLPENFGFRGLTQV